MRWEDEQLADCGGGDYLYRRRSVGCLRESLRLLISIRSKTMGNQEKEREREREREIRKEGGRQLVEDLAHTSPSLFPSDGV